MKKNIIFLGIVLAALLISCESMLDLKPEDAVSKDVFFSDANDFELALTGLYSSLRSTNTNEDNGTYGGNLYWDVAADILFFNFSWHNPWYEISKGNMNPNTAGIGSIWGNAYKTINWANTILEQYEAKKDILDSEFSRTVEGEVRFIRAISYIRLTSLYGAVPLVDKILTPSESKLPRTSVDEITKNLIIPDLDIAIANLKETPYSLRWGRATKQAAMGMKVRALIYIKDYQATVTAAQQLMDLANSSNYVKFLDDYASIFANDNENNPEILFSIKYTAGGVKEGGSYSTPFGPAYIPSLASGSMNGSWSSSAIAPEFIHSYPMTNGLPANESNALYNKDNPWANRGARFENTFYIGDYTILKTGQLFTTNMVGTWNTDYKKAYPFNIDKGYMNEDVKLDWLNEDESDWIVIRYTDVLMMYAEAKTELGQMDASVYEIMDMVRDRAGIAPIARGLNQNDMRDAIRNERNWEFAFEGLRYFDIRRWGIAEQVFNNIISDDPDAGGFNFGTKKLFGTKDYLWPIPQSAKDVNPNLDQNSGY